MAEESPLEVLAQMVLEAKVNRKAVEEELERTPRGASGGGRPSSAVFTGA